MIKYFKNGVLETETLDLPQDCGEIKVTVSLEEDRDDANYYLEFSCPRNVKYISQRLICVADKEYEVVLPRGISEYIGEVYVQMVLMSKSEATLISRSLIARDPLFVIKESILATVALENVGKRDFFDYAQQVVSLAESKIETVNQMIEDIPNVINESVENQLEVVNDTMTEYKNGFDNKVEDIEKNIADLVSSIDITNDNVAKNLEKIVGNTNDITNLQSALDDSNVLISKNAENIDKNAQEIKDTQSEVANNKNRLTSVEGVLPNKFDKSSVKTSYDNNSNNVYSTTYINGYYKKMRYAREDFSYSTSTSFHHVKTITMPVTGYIMIYFVAFYSYSKTTKVGILPHTGVGVKSAVANDVACPSASDAVGAMLCDYVTAGSAIDLYVQNANNSMTNLAYVRYVIVEE